MLYDNSGDEYNVGYDSLSDKEGHVNAQQQEEKSPFEYSHKSEANANADSE